MSLYDHPPSYLDATCGLCGRVIDAEECVCPPDSYTRDRYGNAPGPSEDCPVHATGEHAACSESVEHMIDRRMLRDEQPDALAPVQSMQTGDWRGENIYPGVWREEA